MDSRPRIYRSPDEARGCFGPCALSIGNFDGVHLGHQSIFAEVVGAARAGGWIPAVLTFDPHPAKVVAPDRAPHLLSTMEQRCRWMGECGIGHVLVLPFDRQTASLSPEEFVQSIVVETLDARAVLVGDNFRFGRRQAGDTQTLLALGARYGFQARALPAMRLRGAVISSSEIRKRLLAGEVAKAARMLGRFFALEGPVVKGHGVGARQTVPTLNLESAAEVLPAAGVYVSAARDADSERRWPSVTNIGYRPTFEGDRLSIETFLLEPLAGPPPLRLGVELTHRLRQERKFESPEALREQIMRDAERARRWHRRWMDWRGVKRAESSQRQPLY
ncbi:MAG: bifunctional riboflavin kinase/FAD synthetase [Acidobacteria bacterium]|nr:bifunctional riboflavin kinase/FAD synthetase [Acidobacteriota bacterium]